MRPASRFPAAALAAAAAIVLVEAFLAARAPWCSASVGGWLLASPIHRHPSMSRDVLLNDCRLRDCGRDGRAPVVFLGGSPTLGLDVPYLDERLAPKGAKALLWTYPTGAYPLELLALFDALRALRPAALVIGSGPALFPYGGLHATRLAFLPLSARAFGRLSPLWERRRLIARAVLANAVPAFRYRFLLREALLGEAPGGREPAVARYARPPDLFASAQGEVGLTREQGEAAFEEFLADWTRTGIPLVVWDAPRARAMPDDPYYLGMMRRLSARYAFRFIGPEEEPAFARAEYLNAVHLKRESSARLTRFLAGEVERAVR